MSVWTLVRERDPLKPPVLPVRLVHGVTGFIEDAMHDWTLRGQVYRYFARTTDQPVWVILEFEAALSVRQGDCLRKLATGQQPAKAVTAEALARRGFVEHTSMGWRITPNGRDWLAAAATGRS